MQAWQRMQRPILSTALAVYVVCLFLIMSPPSPVVNALVTFVRPLVSWLGSVTPFGIMGPQVLRKNVYYSAKIKFADGSTKDWEFPHFLEGETTDWQHQKLAFYFLWQYNMAFSNSNALALSAFRYIARHFHDEHNEPVLITIYEHSSEIQEPTDTLKLGNKPAYAVRDILERPVSQEDYQ
jgi:hypothetical protein